jgi:hypothetical protein
MENDNGMVVDDDHNIEVIDGWCVKLQVMFSRSMIIVTCASD